VAQETRGLVPGMTARLRRVSLNPRHWRQTRWLLAAEATVAIAIGVAGLITSVLTETTGTDFEVAGVPLTPTLSALLVIIGATAAASMVHRRAAKWFGAVLSVGAIALVVVSAVAAAHHDPGPLGFTAPAIVLWAVVFCYNLGLLMWLLPDQLEGPPWVFRESAAVQPASSDVSVTRDKP
jgi:hypothetical protein